jgi:hypothetical protein
VVITEINRRRSARVVVVIVRWLEKWMMEAYRFKVQNNQLSCTPASSATLSFFPIFAPA